MPETEEELSALAQALGAGTNDLFLADRARERVLRNIDLDDWRVVAFATHAVVAGQLSGLEEPALVMTPPDVATLEDDGLLTASEITQLTMDADLVILSACNTAAPDGTPGAEGLSGLAKAFFFAGSRALLVSHWSVFSDAATELTTGMLVALNQAPGTSLSGALRQASLELMRDDRRKHFAHPAFWGPFSVVGSGWASL